jgi:hypothetical protein
MGAKAVLEKLKASVFHRLVESIDLDATNTLSPFAALKASTFIEKDIETLQPGSYYLAHLLLPHGPYLLDAQCSYNGMTQIQKNANPSITENLYFQQALCANTLVKRFLSALERSPAKNDNIVIVHGDHGHKLLTPGVREALSLVESKQFSQNDFRNSFSTLFAVRRQDKVAEISRGPSSLAHLLALSLPGIVNSNESPRKTINFLEDIEDPVAKFRLMPLPPFANGSSSTQW